MANIGKQPEEVQRKGYSSLQEQIIIDRREFMSKSEFRNGPAVHLFYHEMRDKAPVLSRVFDWIFGVLLYLTHLVTKPFVILLLKMSGVNQTRVSFNAAGQHGIVHPTKIYNIGLEQINNNDPSHLTEMKWIQKLLLKTGMFKLPQIRGVFKKTCSLVGPELLEEQFARKMMSNYSECHKRFSPKPGVFSPVTYYIPSADPQKNKQRLNEDLKYSGRQTFTNYLRILFFRKLVIR